MSDELDAEMDLNFEAFTRIEPRLLQEHTGKYALMRHGEIVEIFAKVGEAVRAGVQRFPDGLFSAQKIGRLPMWWGLKFADVPA